MTPESVFAIADEVMSRPFSWGVCDCVTATCDVYLRLHGVDLLSPWRGRWTGAVSAERLVRDMGGPLACASEMARRAGLVQGAKTGGIGLSGRTLVVCVTPGIWVGKSKNGFGIVRTSDWAWHA